MSDRSDLSDSFWAPRRCLAEPIPEIEQAARMLSSAVDAHLRGDSRTAEELIARSDMPALGEWLHLIWLGPTLAITRRREVANAAPRLSKDKRPKPRMPTLATCRSIVERDGYHCRFCGIPVLNLEARKLLLRTYPKAARWGPKNDDQHTALQVLWLQFDHVLPNSRGGDSSMDNVMITCAACNFGRAELTLEEVGVLDPRTAAPVKTSWDGLKRLVARD